MSFFRTFIHKDIQQELFDRIDASNYNQNTENVLSPINKKAIQGEYLKTCWARAAVVIGTEGNEQVKVLNSLYDYENKKPINEPLNIKDGNPYRGKPGITSITSTFKEFFMKQSTISFYVPDPKEFDTFKDEFLKFGRYILLEWGWVTPNNLTLDKLSGETIIKMSKGIQERIVKGKGNYTANLGVVTNYNFNQTKEGAYEGTIEISSMGRNILEQQHASDGPLSNVVGQLNDVINEKDKLFRQIRASNPVALGTDNYNVNQEDIDEFVKTFKGQTENLKTNALKIQKTFLTFNSAMEELDSVVRTYCKNNSKSKKLITDTESNTLKEKYGWWENNKASIEQAKSYTYFYHNGAFYSNNENNLLNLINPFGLNAPVFNGYNLYRRIEAYALGESESDNDLSYVTWGWFEDHILNSFFSFTNQDNNVNFKTEFRSVKNTYDEKGNLLSAQDNIECKSHPDLYSLGLQSVILPGKTEEFDIERGWSSVAATDQAFNKVSAISIKFFLDKINKKFPKFETEAGKKGSIRNMVFSTKYLKESFFGTQNIEKSITHFWQKVSEDYGGFWRFSVSEDEKSDGKIVVSDLNLSAEDDSFIIRDKKISTKTDPTQVFKFPVYSQNSIVTDMQLQSSNDSEMATMAVFGSNTTLELTGADMGKGFTANAMRALSAFDGISKSVNTKSGVSKEQYIDNILSNISNPVYGNFLEKGSAIGSSATYDDITGKIETTSIRGGIDFNSIPEINLSKQSIRRHRINNTKKNNEVDVSKESLSAAYYWFEPGKQIQIYGSLDGEIHEEFKRTMLYKINKEPNSDSVFSSVLPLVPLQLSLTLRGIGGIKVGDLFYVKYLPEKYRKYCHFMVVNVDHTIDTSGWTTKLDSRMVVDVPSLIANNEISQVTKLLPINVLESLERTKTFLKKKYGKKQKTNTSWKPNSMENDLVTKDPTRETTTSGKSLYK
jgi:hypothetical protein